MGKLLKPFGLTGKLRVTIFNEVDSALKVGIEIWVQKLTGEYFPVMTNPMTNEEFYIDPTYYWYRQNILELIKNSSTT